MEINQSKNRNNPLPFETRKVQHTIRCTMISVPKRFADYLGITKGDLVKIELQKLDHKGRLVIEKIDLGLGGFEQ